MIKKKHCVILLIICSNEIRTQKRILDQENSSLHTIPKFPMKNLQIKTFKFCDNVRHAQDGRREIGLSLWSELPGADLGGICDQ